MGVRSGTKPSKETSIKRSRESTNYSQGQIFLYIYYIVSFIRVSISVCSSSSLQFFFIESWIILCYFSPLFLHWLFWGCLQTLVLPCHAWRNCSLASHTCTHHHRRRLAVFRWRAWWKTTATASAILSTIPLYWSLSILLGMMLWSFPRLAAPIPIFQFAKMVTIILFFLFLENINYLWDYQ